MFRKFFAPAILATVTLGLATSAEAQPNIEKFRVTVESLMSIQAPSPLVSKLHDESDLDQLFPNQRWLVTANNAAGATATFTTDHAFTNVSDPTYKRNADITLTVNSGPWLVQGTGTARTDYANSLDNVSVSAKSLVPGGAELDLTVKLVEEGFADLAAGDYEMTITGTLAPN